MVLRRSLLLLTTLVLLASGCATGGREIVTSDPPGADIYWGKSETGLAGPAARTPYSRTFVGVNPRLEPFCYQVKKEGYCDSDVICRPAESPERSLHFVLRPVEVKPAAAAGTAQGPADTRTDEKSSGEQRVAGGTAVDDAYVIEPGDILEIQVWKEPDLSQVARVRSDGMISIPLIDDIKAAGRTPLALKKEIEERLQRFVDLPKVAVIVKESASRIYVIGKVAKPGEYPLTQDLTVLQALTLAGGVAEWADSDDIVVIRRVRGEIKRIFFDYDKVISGRKLEQNIYLQPNDTIVVP